MSFYCENDTDDYLPEIKIKGLDTIPFSHKSANNYNYRLETSDTSAYDYENKVGQTISDIEFESASIRSEVIDIDEKSFKWFR